MKDFGVALAAILVFGGCSDEISARNQQIQQPAFDMTVDYEARSGPYSVARVFMIRFTGPGYCRVSVGFPRGQWHDDLDGRCSLRSGGIEFDGEGGIRWFRIDGNNLVDESDGIPVILIPTY